jgi:hypothetical protein
MDVDEAIKLSDESFVQDSITEIKKESHNTSEIAAKVTAQTREKSSDMSLHHADAPPHRDVTETAEEPVPSNSSSPISPSDNATSSMLGSEGLISREKDNEKDGGDTLTDISADEESPENDGLVPSSNEAPTAIVSSTKKSRPHYKYDPEKITLRFLFANKDGLAVTVECKPSDTIGEVKGALLSVWPEGKCTCVVSRKILVLTCGRIRLIFLYVFDCLQTCR